jgi:hypothetical protein
MWLIIITLKEIIMPSQKETSKEIFINNITQSLQLSSLIFSPIFMPSDRKRKDKKLIDIKDERTEFEHLIYKGEELNLGFDFELFAAVISKAQKEQSIEIELTEKELIKKGLKLPLSIKLKERIHQRLKDFKKCDLHIYKFKAGAEKPYCEINTSLIHRIERNKDKGTFEITIDKGFVSLKTNGLSKELILLDDLTAFDKEQERALYLYLETKKFIRKKGKKIVKQEVVSHHVDSLIARVCPNYGDKNDAKKAVKKALITLKNAGYLRDFKFRKRERDDKPLCDTILTHTFTENRPAYVEKRKEEKAQAKKIKCERNNKKIALLN